MNLWVLSAVITGFLVIVASFVWGICYLLEKVLGDMWP